METMKEFLPKRKAEIKEQIAELQAELQQIAVAERVAAEGARAQFVGERKTATIKEQVVKILNDHPRGLNAKEILAQLKSRYGRDVKRESLSPQLSRLGADGTIKRDGKIWILPMVETALGRLKESHAAFKKEESELALASGNGVAGAKENPQELHS